tara:strand:- start:31 stop:195 length:165 start_codon:yes stop_codon:yes gene_type:complete
MMNLIHEPKEYVGKYEHVLTVDAFNEAIENNSLPMGMSIDYALEVIAILKAKEA